MVRLGIPIEKWNAKARLGVGGAALTLLPSSPPVQDVLYGPQDRVFAMVWEAGPCPSPTHCSTTHILLCRSFCGSRTCSSRVTWRPGPAATCLTAAPGCLTAALECLTAVHRARPHAPAASHPYARHPPAASHPHARQPEQGGYRRLSGLLQSRTWWCLRGRGRGAMHCDAWWRRCRQPRPGVKGCPRTYTDTHAHTHSRTHAQGQVRTRCWA